MKRNLIRWLTGASLLVASIWLQPAQAIEQLLYVKATTGNASCLNPGSGALYFGESWGYDAAGTKLCEVTQTVNTSATAFGICAGPLGSLTPPVRHRAYLTIRNSSTRAWLSTVLQGPTFQPLDSVSGLDYIQPAWGSCSSMLIRVQSTGRTAP